MKYVISLVILLIAVGTAIGLYRTSPETKKAVPRRPVPLVQTAEIRPGREKVSIEAFGTVIPEKRISLQSQVAGRIISQSPELIPGGLINEGGLIIQVDPADYELLVNAARAELQEVQVELDLEQGKQVIAELEWSMMKNEIDASDAGKSLALREPHLRLVRARMEKAENRLSQAELALERATIRAPFNALVLEEFIDKGQLVSIQTPLATLAGTDQFRVQVSVPVSVLSRISFPKRSGEHGSPAQVIFQPESAAPVVRKGQVLRLMGELDPEGRMARLLIVIDDPLNLRSGEHDGKILLGSYVQVRIDGGYIDKVYSIPRPALREGDVIWVQDNESKLQIRTVSVVWRRADDVLVHVDLRPGEKLILSRLQSPLPGIVVKSVDE